MHLSNPAFIFHREKFILRNPEANIVAFEEKSAKIFFSRYQQSLISLDASPFGSFVTDRPIRKDDLLTCLSKVEEWSNEHGITAVWIRSFPDAYHPEFAKLIKDALLEFSFRVMYEDISQIINVKHDGLLELDPHKKRRLRNSISRGFEFRTVSSDFLAESYSLIVQSRENKGYPVTMSLSLLQKMFELFPNDYLLFGIFDQKQIIASSVCIKVSDKIMYCFYLGDDIEYRKYSPVTSLVKGIYEFCKLHNFSLLDLGVSTEKGILNDGLYIFKKTFGTVDSLKLTFVKEF